MMVMPLVVGGYFLAAMSSFFVVGRCLSLGRNGECGVALWVGLRQGSALALCHHSHSDIIHHIMYN